jgi:hypothetical protein
MNKTLLALLLAATTSFAVAQSAGAGLAVAGSVGGSVPSKARVGGFVLDGSSNPTAELVSVPVNNGKFNLELPSVVPPGRTLAPLRASSVFWPGVLEPVTVSGQVSTADLRFYVYGDANGNGRRDDSEALQEAVPFVGKAVLVVSFSSGAAQVSAARGFQANLKAGWNGLLIEVGKAVKVSSVSNVAGVSLNAQR